MKQIPLFKLDPLFAGGSLTKGKRKTQRPLSTKKPLHLILKSQSKNLLCRRKEILKFIDKYSQRFEIRAYGVSVQKDHIHFAVKIPSRGAYVKFIRTLSAMLSRIFKVRWRYLPFSRILSWGRDFRNVILYLKKNDEEVFGIRPYEPRKHRYSQGNSGS